MGIAGRSSRVRRSGRPGGSLLWLALLAGLGVPADLVQPLLPAAFLLALGSSLALVLGLMLRAHGLARVAATLLPGFAALSMAQQADGAARGLLAGYMPGLAAWQSDLLQVPPPPAWDAERLRAALAAPGAQPRPNPASPDEALFNALLLDARGDRRGAATALAAALAEGAPRPDALLLHAALRDGAEPAPPATPLLTALALPEPAARVVALEEIRQRDPSLLVLAAEAQARIAASLPDGPSVAEAGRIALAVEAFADEDRFRTFAASFLDPSRALALRDGVAALAWVGEVAARRMTISQVAPLPGQPLLLRPSPPEPAMQVQMRQNDAWVPLPRQAEDPTPTLRLPRPFAPQRLEFRYLDRDGAASPVLVHDLDPAGLIRAEAQRRLQRQGAFALYQPGWTSPGQLNPLPISGAYRAGLAAIEWWTDGDTTPRHVPVAVPDEALLAGNPPRILVEIAPPEESRLLVLTAIYADGSRAEPLRMPIR